ncbi:MAG TPA: hypothetical protein VHK24_15435 [Steroidobacter sp.]|nr:hypothetical protein [Steroidobacter sp.]
MLTWATLLANAHVSAGEPPSGALEVLIGDAYNFDSRTHLEHTQLGKASLDGDYETRGFESLLHYTWRMARWREGRGWELQLLHH